MELTLGATSPTPRRLTVSILSTIGVVFCVVIVAADVAAHIGDVTFSASVADIHDVLMNWRRTTSTTIGPCEASSACTASAAFGLSPRRPLTSRPFTCKHKHHVLAHIRKSEDRFRKNRQSGLRIIMWVEGTLMRCFSSGKDCGLVLTIFAINAT
jgi:hypothetical protein